MRKVDDAASVCHWPACNKHVPIQMCLCVEHWRTLPTEFRERLQQTHRGAANNMRAWNEIERGIQMHKNTSDNMQTRARHQAEHSTANTGGVDMTAFDDDKLRTRDRVLSEQISQIEIKLGRLKALIAEADLRRGTWGTRTIGPGVLARFQQEKRLLLGELNAARFERMKYHNEVKRRDTEKHKEHQETFNEVFHIMAKEILAGPVYDRVVTATIHRMGKDDDQRSPT